MIHESYSGRGEYGDTCWGIRTDQAALGLFYFHLGALAWEQQEADETGEFDADDIAQMIGRSASDSLGRGIIVYFPGYVLDA